MPPIYSGLRLGVMRSRPGSARHYACAFVVLLSSTAVLCGQVQRMQPAQSEDQSCVQAYTAGAYRAAADCFARLALKNAASPDAIAQARLMQARSLLHQDDLSHAEAALRASLQARPDTAASLYLLGHILQRRNLPKESLEVYTKAAALQRPGGEDLRIIALDYVLLDGYRDAIHWLDQAVAFSPDNADAWYDLGRAQMHEGRFTQAAVALRRSLQLKPNSAKAEDNLGICLEAENLSDEAAAAYGRAVKAAQSEQHPSEQPFVDYGAMLNTRNGFKDAVPLLKRATQLNPENSRAFAELSRAYSGVGENAAALTAMERAVALDTHNSRLHFQLGRLYRNAGMADKAKHEFELSSTLYGQQSSE